MKVLFDAYWWWDGPPSGKMVVRELVQCWSEIFPHDQLHLALPAGSSSVSSFGPNVLSHSLKLKPHALSVILELGRLAKRLEVDQVVTQNFTPLSGKASVFVHDVLFQSNKEFFKWQERIYLSLIPLTMRRARLVLTSSKVESDRIRAHNRNIKNVASIGLAVGTGLSRSSAQRPSGIGDVEKFILTVGRLNARKNLESVLRACSRSRFVSAANPLVVVGEANGKGSVFDAATTSFIASGSVLFLGRASDAELKWLYQNASATVCLSMDEGFGLPPMEALTFGSPVLISDIPVFREIYSGCATFVQPTDIDAIAREIDVLLDPQSINERVSPPQGYAWADTVRKLRANLVEMSDA